MASAVAFESGKIYTLSLDQGGHASRALVFDQSGRLKASAECDIRTRTIGRLRVEHAPQALLKSLQKAADTALRKLPRRAEVQAAALATQRSSIACWDRRNGRALSPVISWQDRRAIRRVAALAPHTQEVRALTGLVLSPHYGASKLAWCLEHLATVRQAQRRGQLAAGPLASFIVANLASEQPCVADPVNGGRTQLLDVERGAWSQGLCEIFGVPREILPDCVPDAYRFGHLRPVAAASRSLWSPATSRRPCSPRAAASRHRIHEYRHRRIRAMLGSTAVLVCCTASSGAARGTLFALEGTVNGAGTALDGSVAMQLGLAKAMRLLAGWLADGQDRRYS